MYSMKAIASFEKHKGHTSFAYQHTESTENMFDLGVFWNKLPKKQNIIIALYQLVILNSNSRILKNIYFRRANVALAPQETNGGDYFLAFLDFFPGFVFPVSLEELGGATAGLEADASPTPEKPASRAFFIE